MILLRKYISTQCIYFSKLMLAVLLSIRATNEYKDCQIVATEGKYFLRPYAWAFQKHSPYLDAFNFYLQEFNQKGLWNAIQNKYEPLPQVCPDLSGEPLEWASVFSAFLFLIGGAVLAFLCLGIEFVIGRDFAARIGLGVHEANSDRAFTLDEMQHTIAHQVNTILSLQKEVLYFKNMSGYNK